MKVAFVVNIEMEVIDPTQLLADAEAIADSLEASGFQVESVSPWERPSSQSLIPPSSMGTLQWPTNPQTI